MSQADNSVNHSGAALGVFFERYRARGAPLVLATVVTTLGSTYRKAGAQMLIARDGAGAGLLSGGCLESDLMERARAVLDTGTAMIVEYDTRSSDDVLWGIGLGCEGAMKILLTRLDANNDYQPFAHVERCRRAGVASAFALVIASQNPSIAVGQAYVDDSATAPTPVRSALLHATTADRTEASPVSGTGLRAAQVTSIECAEATFLVVPIELPIRLLVLGAGPDVMPLVDIAALLGWNITVLDHRPAYAVAQRFPRAHRVAANPARELPEVLQSSHFDAAVVMSHHLTSDEAYLAALAESSVPYVGLLGPALRRMRLLKDIGDKAQLLGNRLHGPIGLDIGARTPEAIALAIVAEIQAVLCGRSGRSFSAIQSDAV